MEHNTELKVRDRGYLTRISGFSNKAGKVSLLPSVSYTGFHHSCWYSPPFYEPRGFFYFPTGPTMAKIRQKYGKSKFDCTI